MTRTRNSSSGGQGATSRAFRVTITREAKGRKKWLGQDRGTAIGRRLPGDIQIRMEVSLKVRGLRLRRGQARETG
jgi:hypothetical protein